MAVRDAQSIEPLMAQMELEEGRLQADIGEALSEITGKNFGQSLENWRSWWERTKDRFVIPTDEELAKARAARAEARERYKPSGQTTFHGIETPSRSILFIIDVSGSMEAEVVERERFADGEYPSFRRIDIVKTELARTVEGLESYVNFNILSFATDIDQWKKKLVSANVLNKKSAVDWAKGLEAIGGSSKEGLAGVGLTGSANLEKGKTNTYGALMAGLDIAAPGETDKDYEVEVDTIFFLSDGRPTHGELVDVDDILTKVNEANELRKVVIHTIALGEFQKSFMERLAKENGGVFVDLGR
jgi:Mg-chelatase subunit ChlD